MDLQRPSGDLSVLENSIIRAILGDIGSECSVTGDQLCRGAAVDSPSVCRSDDEVKAVEADESNITAVENNSASYNSSYSSSSSSSINNSNSGGGSRDVRASVGSIRRSRDSGTHPGHDDSASDTATTTTTATTTNTIVSHMLHHEVPVMCELNLKSSALQSMSIITGEHIDHSMNVRKALSYLSVLECSEFAKRKGSRVEEMTDWEVGEEWGSFSAPTSARTDINPADPSSSIIDNVTDSGSKSRLKRKSVGLTDGDELDEIAAIMGFGSFKKSNNAS